MPATAAREAWGLFWRIFSEDKRRRMAIFAELGLAPMQAQALIGLEPGVPLAMSALAERIHCDNSNVTGIADRLEAAGAIERRPADPPPVIATLPEADAAALRDILRRATERLEG